MTQEERKRYFKYYRGEDRCPEEWRGEPEGIIWSAERLMDDEVFWAQIVSGEWDEGLGWGREERTLQERITDIVISTAQKFDPWDWKEVAKLYASTPGRAD